MVIRLYKNQAKTDSELTQLIRDVISNVPAVVCFCNYPREPCHYSVIKKVISCDI